MTGTGREEREGSARLRREDESSERSGGKQPHLSGGEVVRLVGRGVLGNSPWKIFLGFKAVIAAAFATGSYALIFPTIWQLGDTFGRPRLVALMLVAMVALVLWMIVAHDLWERSSDEAEQDPRITPSMQNAVTVLTLTTAVLFSYAVMYGLIFLAAFVFVSKSVIQASLHHPVDLDDYARLAWVATSISTITGALGSGLEDDKEIRDAVNYR